MIFVRHKNGIPVKRSQRGDDNNPGFLRLGTRKANESVKSIPRLQKCSGHGKRNTRRDSRERLTLSGRRDSNVKKLGEAMMEEKEIGMEEEEGRKK